MLPWFTSTLIHIFGYYQNPKSLYTSWNIDPRYFLAHRGEEWMLESESLEHSAHRNLIDRVVEARPKHVAKAIRDSVSKLTRDRTDLKVDVNPATGQIDFIRGISGSGMTGSPAEIASASMADFCDSLGLAPDLSDVIEVDRFEWAGVEHVRFQQTYEGTPMFGRELLVAVDPTKGVSMAAGDIEPAPSIAEEEEVISKKEAIQLAMEDLGDESNLRGQISSEVILYPTAKGFARCYQIMIPAANPLGDWQYFIGTSSADIVDSANLMRFIIWPLPYTAGRGTVFQENPNEVKTTGVLRHLRWPYRRLNGRYSRIENDDGPEALGQFPGFKFYYPTNNTHFDEVNCYHAVDRVYRHFDWLGFRGFKINNTYGKSASPKGQMRAHVHTGTNYPNAFYSPATGEIYFGDGNYSNTNPNGLRDLARENDVIFHEFGHAVIDEIRPGIVGTDGGALHEAYADYFACSLTDESLLGEWVVPGAGSIRDLNNNNTYPNAPTSPHQRGLVWGGACWDLRQAVGVEVADYLLFGSLLWLTSTNPTFKYAKDRLLAVDRIFCGREYEKTIRNIFENQRGIPA